MRTTWLSVVVLASAGALSSCGSSDSPGATPGGTGGTGGAAGTGGSAGSGGTDADAAGGSGAGDSGTHPGDAAKDAPFDGGAKWSCVGKVSWGTPSDTHFTHNITFVGVADGAHLAGLTVKGCSATDVACTTPTATTTTAADGSCSIDVPATASGFGGYIDVSGSPILHDRIFVRPPVSASTTTTYGEITPALLDTMATTGGATLDHTRAVVAVTGLDCKNSPAQGLTFAVDTADASTKVLYFDASGAYVDPVATETSITGFAVIVNVPAGAMGLTAKRSADGVTVATATAGVAADAVTSLFVPPTP